MDLDTNSPTVGRIREGQCTPLCKEVFWEIDDALHLCDSEEDFISPQFSFGMLKVQINFLINIDSSRVFIVFSMCGSFTRHLILRGRFLRADGTEYWMRSTEVMLDGNLPEMEPVGSLFGPQISELIREKSTLISEGVLTFSLKISTPPPALTNNNSPTVGRIREGQCTALCKEVFWEIDDALHLWDSGQDCSSPQFSFGMLKGKINFIINSDSNRIFMLFSMCGSFNGHLILRGRLLRADGTEYWTGSTEVMMDGDHPKVEPIGTFYGPHRSELIREESPLISEGVITFSLKISTPPPALTDINTLSQNLKDMYIAGKECDVTLNVRDKKFRAHKLILGARTPVLAAMFSHNMAEAETGVVRVEDCSSEAFDIFLLFVYSGIAENLTGENVMQVYYIADKYDLPGLKEVCVQHMLSTLATDSVCSVLALATRHGEEVLLEKASEFFVKNARQIFRTAAWQTFMVENSSLANDLIIRGYGYENVK